ncbi:MAG: GNAT family N-acetyltransferase [Alteromonadaceae bacterium]|nr:GNAT family N-acetyltransferase [Alteromonadaceae bacterium]
MNLKHIETREIPEMLRLNNNEVPHVNELDEKVLNELINEAAFARVMADEYAIAGFVIGFEKGASYEGYNYNWFSQRLKQFLYIDRIIVNPQYRGKKLGNQLYDAAQSHCVSRHLDNLCCEVNDEPPNPASHAFHLQFGFKKLESILHPAGKTVCMYNKEI